MSIDIQEIARGISEEVMEACCKRLKLPSIPRDEEGYCKFFELSPQNEALCSLEGDIQTIILCELSKGDCARQIRLQEELCELESKATQRRG